MENGRTVFCIEIFELTYMSGPSIFLNVWNSQMFQYHFRKWNGLDRLIEMLDSCIASASFLISTVSCLESYTEL